MSELYFEVPARAKRRPCRECGQIIAFVKTSAGRWMPVNAPENGQSKGQSHYQTCSNPARFSRAG